MHSDMGHEFHALYQSAAPYTMTSIERMFGLYEACRYISAAGIPGDVVECGVWRGGSSMLAALTLMRGGDVRPMWLYDTFEGMPPPGEHDREWSGAAAEDHLAAAERRPGAANVWAYAPEDDVRTNMAATEYPEDMVRFVAGKVEETIPAQAPEQIAILRLDTDWYESTRHELEHLWPRLQPGGVLIIDDYGHWQGARRATDEFFAAQGTPILLARLDYTGRIAVKTGS